MKAPVYKNRPIASVESLSRTLAISNDQLLELAEQAEQFYFPSSYPTYKADGKLREIYRVEDPLKKVQKSILQQIFYKVECPDYLQGSIRDEEFRRDYITNAQLHADKRIILREDISNFFSSVDAFHVKKMWQHLFNFPENIAIILTHLTTYRGVVPQGASTSSYIGNLIFWDREPELQDELQKRGFCYSRYVDDVTISADRYVSANELQWVTSKLYGMLLSKGVRPNRKKRSVQTNSGRMTVHKLSVNSKKPTLGKNKLSKIRATVKQLEKMATAPSLDDTYKIQFARVYGQIVAMSRIHPQKAQVYLDRLHFVRPKE